MSKLYDEPISVTAKTNYDIREFIWRNRRYGVQAIVKCWRVRHSWWSDDGGVNRWYFRIQAANGSAGRGARGDRRMSDAGPGTYDIYFDANGRRWCLERIWD